MMQPPRSYLFVPAHRPDRYDKALASGADAVIVDLEDAVGPDDKKSARAQLDHWLKPESPVYVRINAVDTPWFRDDLSLCQRPGVAGVVLSKAERADDIALVAATGRPVIALVETARGVDRLREVAGARGVSRLAFGSLDFQIDVGIEGDDDALLFVRSQLVLASRLAGLAPPVDGVSTVFDDPAVFEAEAARARRLGFGGKLCIHPRQVAGVHAAFAIDAKQLDWAQRVLATAAQAGNNAVAVDGKMVDKPVLVRAQAIVDAAVAQAGGRRLS
jgi:citrate lyase subunit beta/citryl-CoA lyase